MTDTRLPDRERLDLLLADRALFGFSEEEQSDLASLAARFPDADVDCFDRIAATVDLAFGAERFQPMPASLQAAVREQAMRHLSEELHRDSSGAVRTAATMPLVTARRGYREAVAWTLAAASLAAALIIGFRPFQRVDPIPSMADARKQLVGQTDEVILIDWQTTDDPAAQQATGAVAWNNAIQQGYMRFRGLLANDPDQYQYQLWIFDSERDDRYPIDGGVFDVRGEEGQVIVPIRAKLQVLRPAMFAVTVEKPGGVVVSNRERICLIAKVDG